jgi:hypothetical protein
MRFRHGQGDAAHGYAATHDWCADPRIPRGHDPTPTAAEIALLKDASDAFDDAKTRPYSTLPLSWNAAFQTQLSRRSRGCFGVNAFKELVASAG